MGASRLDDKPNSNPEETQVLVVEDEILLRLMLTEELRAAGYHVLEARDADEAVPILLKRPRIQLVLTDIMMPGSMDGVDLAQWIRRTRKEVKIVLISGHTPPPDISHYSDAHFQKPFDLADLLNRVKELTS